MGLRLLLLTAFSATSLAFGQTLLSTGSAWKYNDGGQDPGVTWKDVSYADNTWASGNAELGYGDGDEQTIVSYGTDPDNKHITTYFRKTFYVANPAVFTQIEGTVKRDDGVIIYINGVEIYRSNMPAGPVTYTTVASGTVAWPNEDDFQNFGFSPALLQAGNNLIAVEIHQDEANSSDISFDCSLSGNQTVQNYTVTRGPYLQVGTPHSVIVRWRTDLGTDSRVRYGTSPGNLNQSSMGFSLTTEHEVAISGLLPQTTYYYTVGNSVQAFMTAAPEVYFKTSPLTGTTGFYRFWAIGDAGTGNDDQRHVRDGFTLYNQGAHVDGWIMLGDNAYGTGIDDGQQQYYQQGVFANMYENTLQNTVLWPSPGNHDYNNHIPFSPPPAYYDIFTLPTSAEAGGVPSGTEKYYSYNYGNIHFIVLDSYDEEREPSSPMVLWLTNDLQQNNADWTIAYFHHPPYTKGSHDSDNSTFLDGELVEIRENIVPILEQYGVDLVLNGHSHSYERSFLMDGHYGYSEDLEPYMVLDGTSGAGVNGECPYQKHTKFSKSHKGTVYAVVGCSGKLSGTASGWPHDIMYAYDNTRLGSLVFDVQNNRLDAAFVEIDGSVFDRFSILKNAGKKDSLLVCPNEVVTLIPSFPGPAHWMPNNVTADSLTVSTAFSTIWFANDNNACITDTFVVTIDQSPDCNLEATENVMIKQYISVSQWTDDHFLPVNWSGFSDAQVEMTIYSIYGQTITHKELENKPANNQWLLPAELLPTGSYFIRISDTKSRAIIQFIRN